MLKFQISLIAILICCMAFMSCDRSQDALEVVMVKPPAEHLSWMSVTLPVPMGTTAHDAGSRTIYFNEAAAMTNMAEGDKMYPVGSMIVKEAMNADNTEITQIVSMTKSDDPEYMDYGGWIYGVGGNNLAVADSVGCDGCHAKAGEGNDYVFVSLKMDANGDTNGDANGDTNGDANGDTNGDANGDTNGDANGDTNGDANGDTNGDANGDTNGDANGDTNGDGDTGNGDGDTGNGDGDTGNGSA